MFVEYEYTGKAMGTDFSIALVSDSDTLMQTVAQEAETMIRAYEARFSRFIPESELSQLNIKKDMVVSDVFLQVTQEAYRNYRRTQGIFNPLVQIERLGYDRDFTKIRTHKKTLPTEPYDIDFSSTRIDTHKKRIVLRDGQKLDFGGFLKGYLAEILCTHITHTYPTISGVIVNIGGDLHTKGLDEKNKPFTFAIYNPVTQKDILVQITNKSLATSGTYQRTWKHANTHIHHFLDPTGLHNPETPYVSASVIYPDGGASEAYAKTLLLLGPEKASILLSNTHMQYVVITHTGDVISNIV